jgi:hypothetical protein
MSIRVPLLVLIVAGWLAATACAQPAKGTLDSRWADLTSSDEAKATRAMLSLAATPKETLAYLQDQLKPVKADTKQVEKLLKQLESSNFAVRARAMAELEYQGKYIKADLEAAHKSNSDAEVKARINELLDKLPKEKKKDAPMPMLPKGQPGVVSVSNINGQVRITIDGQVIDLSNLGPAPPPPPPPGPPAGWVRAVRAVTVLEHLGTPQARALLEAIAAGEADAMPTVAAREALGRLKK